MFPVPHLRHFIMERLTSAAEEIFFVFEKTIIEYEEQIDRQRRLLDEVYKPQLKLRRIEHQHVYEDQDQQQVCVQENNSSLDQEDPEPAQIKEEKLCICEEGEQLVLKQETEDFMVDAAPEERDHSEDQIPYFNIENIKSLEEEKTSVCAPVQSSMGPEANSDQQLVSHNSDEAESQDQRGGKHGDSTSTTAEPEHNSHTMSAVHCDTYTGKTPFNCHVCEEGFNNRASFQRHMTKHTGEKRFPCNTCGKDFRYRCHLKSHMRIHTGERPFSCKTCGKQFRVKIDLKCHMRIHTGEKKFTCETCGKDFYYLSYMKRHMKSHTAEKSYTCKTCGKDFRFKGDLKNHMRIHTDEKPYTCTTCGKAFGHISNLKCHLKIHTGEKPFTCQTCGKDFRCNSDLKKHMGNHTG